MDRELKVYEKIGLNTKHIENIDRIYGAVLDNNFKLEQQPQRIKNTIRHLAELPANLRPNFIFESQTFNRSGAQLKNFANKILMGGKKLKYN